MVVSSPTYHIVSNIIPEYAGGRHKLGTIVDNLKDMTPLNEDEEIEIPAARRFCIHEEKFEATRDQIKKGSGGIGMKFVVLQIPVGGDIGGGGEGSVDEIYTAESLDTEWFYPKKEDYTKAIEEATGLQSYLEESGYKSVYMITGIKIGRQPSVTLKKGDQVEGHFQLGIDLGNGGTIGPKGEGSRVGNVMQKAEKSSDLVLGVRVRKLSYKKRYWLFGERVWTDKPGDKGAELVGMDGDKDVEGLEIDFEADEQDLGDEMTGFVEHAEEEAGESVTWVVPETTG